MKKFVGIFLLILLTSFVNNGEKIRWKKVKTEEQARNVMDKIILPGSNYDEDMKILACQKYSFFEGSGDTVIYFHSPEVPVHFAAFVVRKWMYLFRFSDKKLQAYTVKEGLTGP